MASKPKLHLVADRKSSRPAPVEHVWTDGDRERFEGRFWRLPKHAVEDGLLARVWGEGSTRGYPTASSILPVLSINAWTIGKDEWSPWIALSHRTIAATSGVDKNSVRGALLRLEELKLIETRQSARDPREGGLRRSEYRAHCSLFPTVDHPDFFRVHGSLIYGGVFAMLPRASARHLFLAIGALDPIHDEQEVRDRMQADGEGRDIEASMVRRRNECATTISALSDVTGMALSTVQEGLDILQRPWTPDPKLPLVRSGRGQHGRYYFIDHRALSWFWEPSLLNSPAARREVVREIWGGVLRRAA